MMVLSISVLVTIITVCYRVLINNDYVIIYINIYHMHIMYIFYYTNY